jgi:hypothetical protein
VPRKTHFTDKSYINIPTYKTYQTNHPDGKAHGGTAIIIKATTDHFVLQKYEEPHIQATSIPVTALPYPFTVSAIYCPPRFNLKETQYETFFRTLRTSTANIPSGDQGSPPQKEENYT